VKIGNDRYKYIKTARLNGVKTILHSLLTTLFALLYNILMPYQNYQPILEVTRGPVVESVHFGAAAVVDIHGRLLASWGDPYTVTYLRSSAKPIQALPLIEMGGADAFGLIGARNCHHVRLSSRHGRTRAGGQRHPGSHRLSEADLLCGSHDPGRATLKAMLLRGEEPSPVRHNCSGKHTGMLAQALLRGLSKEDYINPNHPVQQLNLKVFAEMCSLPECAVALGTMAARPRCMPYRCTMPRSPLRASVIRPCWKNAAPPPAAASCSQ
jgi:L-asparaginase II